MGQHYTEFSALGRGRLLTRTIKRPTKNVPNILTVYWRQCYKRWLWSFVEICMQPLRVCFLKSENLTLTSLSCFITCYLQLQVMSPLTPTSPEGMVYRFAYFHKSVEECAKLGVMTQEHFVSVQGIGYSC